MCVCVCVCVGGGGGDREVQANMEETDGEKWTVDPQKRSTWRSGVRSAMGAGS